MSMKKPSESKKITRSLRSGSFEYRLHESIKHVGLLQPLLFVKNSETQNYELFGGGHTRFKLIEAIQQERKKHGLEPVPFPIVSRDELATSTEIGLSHLIQNHIRHRRKFIDKALHLLDCVETREKEIARKMSQRETVKWLRQSGFPISQSLFSDMKFTAKELYPLLPQAISNGLGRRNIVSIRTFYRAMREVWKFFGEDFGDCQEAFQDICEECDEKIFDIKLFQEVMEREICLWCGLNSQFVRALLQVSCDVRTRLIETFNTSKRKTSPVSRSVPKSPQQKSTDTISGVPTSKFAPLLFELPPAVINRRKRFARRLALDLAKHANLLYCVSGSITNPIGYRVLCPPSSDQAPTTAIWQFLNCCQHAVQSTNLNDQRLSSGWCSINRKEFLRACSLVEVTHTLCAARREPKSMPHLQKAA